MKINKESYMNLAKNEMEYHLIDLDGKEVPLNSLLQKSVIFRNGCAQRFTKPNLFKEEKQKSIC